MSSCEHDERWLIGIPTFKRPERLGRLLLQIATQVDGDAYEICVVDNDPAGSAEDVVLAATSRASIRYLRESRPGVVNVRNRLLEEAAGFAVLVCLDDDVEIEPGFFAALRMMHGAYPHDVLSVAVRYYFESESRDSVLDRYLRTTNAESHGAALRVVGAGAVAVPVEAFTDPNVWFDPTFASTGGEDTDWFLRLRDKGVTIRRCATAGAREALNSERGSRQWVRRRAIASGAVRATRSSGPLRGPERLAGGCARILVGTMLLILRRLRRPYELGDEFMILSGIGYLSAAFGRVPRQYGEAPK